MSQLFARVNTVRGDGRDLDQGVVFMREALVEKLGQYPGFEGVMLLANRARGVGFAITFWKSEDDLAASQEDAQELTERAAQAFDARVEVTDCEVAFSTFGSTPTD